MENKEQDFINRYKNVQESIVKAMGKEYGYAYKNWWNWKGLIWQNIL